jgi:DNA topoisomerase-1
LPEGTKPSSVTLEQALQWLSLPRVVGQDVDGTEIIANNGRFGPYLMLGSTFVSIKAPDDVYTINEARAIEVINTSGKKGTPLGIHNEQAVSLHKGRFGYYLNYGKEKVYLPKGTEATSVTLDFVLPLLEKHDTKPKAAKTTKTTATKTSKAKPKAAAKKKPTTSTSASTKRSTVKTAAKKTSTL